MSRFAASSPDAQGQTVSRKPVGLQRTWLTAGEKAQRYVLHSSGLYGLMGWVSDMNQRGYVIEHTASVLRLDIQAARLFAMVRHPRLKTPFLAIQFNERRWMQLVHWEKALIRPGDPTLYLMSRMIEGDESRYPDLSSVTIAIPIDDPSKMDVFKGLKSLDVRGMFLEDGEIRLDLHRKIVSMPLEFVAPEVVVSEYVSHIGRTRDDLLNAADDLMRSRFDGKNVEFKGSVGHNELSQSVLSGWNNIKAKVASTVYKSSDSKSSFNLVKGKEDPRVAAEFAKIADAKAARDAEAQAQTDSILKSQALKRQQRHAKAPTGDGGDD